MLTVTILNYNGKDIIQKCLDSVLKQSIKPDEILLIDNSSTDDSWKLVENQVTRVIHASNEFKFITGLNTAFEEAKHGLITFMENDVMLDENFIKNTINHFGQAGGIVSPAFFDSKFHKYKIEWYSGFLSACFTMWKSTFEKIGKFDENLAPAYWEDVDYSIRAHQIGIKTYKNVGKAIHYANYSFSKVFSKKQMGAWCRRNAWYVIKKHYLSRVFPWLYNGRTFSSNNSVVDSSE